MSHKNKRVKAHFFISLLTTIVLLSLVLVKSGLVVIINDIILPLARISVFIFVTLLITGYLESSGYINVIHRRFLPLVKISGLSSWSLMSFSTAFFSGITSNTLLYNAYLEGKIDKKELFLANILNHSIPAYFLHTPTVISVIVPVLGISGLVYILITFVSSLFRGIFIILLSRRILMRYSCPLYNTSERPVSKDKSFFSVVKGSIVMRFSRILLWTIPVYTLVVYLKEIGFFSWLEGNVSNYFTELIPIEGITVIVFSILLEFNAGVIAAGALQNGGILSTKETILALIIGTIIASPIQALRHQLPTYMGIYTPLLGLQLILINQLFRIISLLIVGLPLFLLIF